MCVRLRIFNSFAWLNDFLHFSQLYCFTPVDIYIFFFLILKRLAWLNYLLHCSPLYGFSSVWIMLWIFTKKIHNFTQNNSILNKDVFIYFKFTTVFTKALFLSCLHQLLRPFKLFHPYELFCELSKDLLY